MASKQASLASTSLCNRHLHSLAFTCDCCGRCCALLSGLRDRGCSRHGTAARREGSRDGNDNGDDYSTTLESPDTRESGSNDGSTSSRLQSQSGSDDGSTRSRSRSDSNSNSSETSATSVQEQSATRSSGSGAGGSRNPKCSNCNNSQAQGCVNQRCGNCCR